MIDEENDNEEFNNFISSCAETLHFALQVSDKKWRDNSKEVRDEVIKISNDVVMSVVGNRVIEVCDFEEEDYDLIFVATLRKALSIVDGVEF